MYVEDRTTYEARTPPARLPYDAILGHEAGHAYIAHESLTQFLELYLYNLARTGSTDPLAWTFTRSWTPDLETNTGIAAVLDVYKLIGFEAMQRSYRAIHPLRPPYGQPLPTAVIDAFILQAPEALRSAVATKLSQVGF